MAIKIIKPGVITYEVTCKRCGCVFTCNENDWHDWYDKISAWGGSDIKCPCCGETIDKEASICITKNNKDK